MDWIFLYLWSCLGEVGIMLNSSPGFVAVEVVSDREALDAAALADPRVDE